MKKIMGLTIAGYIEKIRLGELTSDSVLDECLKIAKNTDTNAYITVSQSYAEAHKDAFKDRFLHAAPISVKDLIMTQGVKTTCGSAILADYIPPFSATCFEKLEEAGGLLIGKTNQDEFAMGGSNEHSAFGPVKNPFDASRVSGGSSGGSAVSVAIGSCLASLGTDTGGSVRQPAAFCGLVGLKPTYGRISRYGVQAMASSLDQVGPITKTVEDAKILLQLISGHDSRDATTSRRSSDMTDWDEAMDRTDLQGKKFAIPKQFFTAGLDETIKKACLETIERIRGLGAEVDEIDLPIIEYGVPIYYIIMPAQGSTNLARFDGIRYGLSHDTKDFDSIYDYYATIRNEGFGDEVKRRILTGTYVLSSGYYDAYYNKAMQARKKLIYEISKVFENYDAIIGPTTPTFPWKIGEKKQDPLSEYLEDIYTVIANLAGIPAISIPIGYGRPVGGEYDLPIGFQIMTPKREEGRLLGIAKCIEREVGFQGLS